MTCGWTNIELWATIQLKQTGRDTFKVTCSPGTWGRPRRCTAMWCRRSWLCSGPEPWYNCAVWPWPAVPLQRRVGCAGTGSWTAIPYEGRSKCSHCCQGWHWHHTEGCGSDFCNALPEKEKHTPAFPAATNARKYAVINQAGLTATSDHKR